SLRKSAQVGIARVLPPGRTEAQLKANRPLVVTANLVSRLVLRELSAHSSRAWHIATGWRTRRQIRSHPLEFLFRYSQAQRAPPLSDSSVVNKLRPSHHQKTARSVRAKR